jgi:hypothetical protein
VERIKQHVSLKKNSENQWQHQVSAGERKYLFALDDKKRENAPVGHPRKITLIHVTG